QQQGAEAGEGGGHHSTERQREGPEVRPPSASRRIRCRARSCEMNHAPIELGSILFTLVEPHRGHEVAYNRWYERDHFYAGCMVGPWCFAGRRFVATRACKDLRYPDDSPVTPDRLTGSYLGLYWILDGHHDEWNRWAVDQVIELHADGRMFSARDHTHTLLYRYEWGAWPR